MRLPRVGAPLLGLLLLAPLASGEPVGGTLAVSGAVTGTGDVRAEASPWACFLDETTHAQRLEIRAERLVVHLYEARYKEAALSPEDRIRSPVEKAHASFPLTRATVELADGDRSGWMGLDFPSGDPVRLTNGTRLVAKPAQSLSVGDGDADSEDDMSYYQRTIRQAGWRIEGASHLAHEGALRLKLSGPDLVIAARENTTRIETGVQDHEGIVGDYVMRWAVLEYARGAFEYSDPGVAVCAAREGAMWTDGSVRFERASGSVTAGAATYAPEASVLEVAGVTRVSLTSEQRQKALVATVEGDVESATLGRGAVSPAPAARSAWLLPAGLLVLAAAGAGGYAVARRRRRAKGPAPGPDDCLELAHSWFEAGDVEHALAWIRRAREASPGSARLLLEEAFLLDQAGRADEALARLDEAAARGMEGEALFHKARLLLRRGARAEASACFRRALAEAPVLVVEIDGTFDALLQEPECRAAVQRARAALERGE